MLSRRRYWMILIVVCLFGCDGDIDGGFGIMSQVSFDGVSDLSYAPVFVQGYAPPDIDSDGHVVPGAVPLYELLASGPMDSGQASKRLEWSGYL